SADNKEGCTYINPRHGRLCDEADVVEYRDMLTIIRDRIQNMIKKGMTLQQVKAAKPTSDYDPRWGATSGFWTTDMFVEAAYQSVSARKELSKFTVSFSGGKIMKRRLFVLLIVAVFLSGAQAYAHHSF